MPDQKPTLEYARPRMPRHAENDDLRHDTVWAVAAVAAMFAVALLAVVGRSFIR
jgi:hypothetical protein